MKKPPRVIRVYDSLPKNPKWPKQEWKPRVIQYVGTDFPLFDLREFITDGTSLIGEPYTGFTPKGTALRLNQLRYLFKILPSAIRLMEKLEPKGEPTNVNVNVTTTKDTVSEDQQGSATDNGMASSSEEIREAMPNTSGDEEVQ